MKLILVVLTVILGLSVSESYLVFAQSPTAQENGTVVYFMKTNSSSNLYLKIIPAENMDVRLYPIVYTYPELYNLSSNDSISIVPTQSSAQGTQQPSINATYTITAKNNLTGTFEIFLGSCTNFSFIPLVIGLNESKIDPQIFHNFHHEWVSISCPPADAFIRQTKIIGYDGITSKIITVNKSNTSYARPLEKTLSPLKQFKSGISIENVQCYNGLQLIGKRIDGSPACVSSSTFAKLISRGWGYDPIHVWTVNGLNDKYTTKDVIQFTVFFKGITSPCHNVTYVVVKDAIGKTIWQSTNSMVLCPVSNHVIYLENERSFSFNINKTGTYSASIFDFYNSIILQKNITITSKS